MRVFDREEADLPLRKQTKFFVCSTRNLVTILTELYWQDTRYLVGNDLSCDGYMVTLPIH
jgi:hypothetical protein